MDKTAIKTFAVKSRKKLIEDVAYKMSLVGITKEEIFDPISSADGMETYSIGGTTNPIFDEDIFKRQRLVQEVLNKGFDNVVEEVAYTWFNRIIAIRYMEVNNYLPTKVRVLSSETEGKIDPDIITYASDIDLDYTEEDKALIKKFKMDEELDELFRFLFIKQCNKLNEVLPGLFEKTDDYLELLLNISFINEEGVVRQLIDSIPEEDFTNQVEIIGWLYQFYIFERKDAVNTSLKSKPIKKEDIPAATQLFTPDWIVKYMVDNSLGRYWIERNKESQIRNYLDYYFEEPSQDSEVKSLCENFRLNNISIEELKFFDPCMGSGHILVYAFDLFMKIYEELGYSKSEIPESIIKNNLFGLDIDERAYQLAYFALMMKGRKHDKNFLIKNIIPNVLPIKDSHLSQKTLDVIKEFDSILGDVAFYLNDIFIKGSEFGSLIQVKELNFDYIDDKIDELIKIKKQNILDYNIINEIRTNLISLVSQAKILSLKYHAVVTNPPYLNKYDKSLKEFSKKYYDDYSRDLFSMFIYRNFDFCTEYGYTAFMTPMVWMYIKNFEKLREYIIDNKSFVSLIEMEYHTLWEIYAYVPGCTFVLSNQNYNSEYLGSFLKLTEFTGGLNVQKRKVEESINLGFNDKNKFITKQLNFKKIPGNPIAYWINENLINSFINGVELNTICDVKQGLITGDTKKFLRFWYEVNYNNIGFNINSNIESKNSKMKWFPYNKGGNYRKWYGNHDYVVNWYNDGYEIKNFKGENGKLKSRPQNTKYNFNPSISWSSISSSEVSFRYFPNGFLFDVAGSSIFGDENNFLYILGILNSSIIQEILNVLSPTINYSAGYISLLPIIKTNNKLIEELVKENIDISKNDWDDYENSWNFKSHPLIRYGNNSLKNNFIKWENYKKEQYNLLKKNEIKLNELVYDIYSVDYNSDYFSNDTRISLKKSNLISDIKSFISYAVGCMFGRYSLDTEGLQFAGGEFNINNYLKFVPDNDNIIPILDTGYFDDDIVGRFVEFVKTCFGEEHLEENLDFIADALANNNKNSRDKIRDYLVKNFFNDHKKTYKNCPIYWQFSSGKENGFNCIIYMHRYEPSLVARIRTEYLLKTQDKIKQAIDYCDYTINHSSSNSEKNKATKEKSKLQKQLKETQEYDEALAHIANQNMEIDLDDGVKVNYAKFQNVEVSREGSKTKKINLLKKI